MPDPTHDKPDAPASPMVTAGHAAVSAITAILGPLTPGERDEVLDRVLALTGRPVPTPSEGPET